jgi:alkylation response protein AidB-like acyl-CoA dehydrogenase
VELTQEQRALRDAVRALLARHERRPAAPTPALTPPAAPAVPAAPDSGPGGGQGHDQALWRRLCGEIGVAGLAVPERYGGAGAGPVETHIVAEELGRDLTPSPLLGSAVLAAQALLASGNTAACERLLPAIADGAAIAALAWTGPDGHWDSAQAACHATPAGPADSQPPGPQHTSPQHTSPQHTSPQHTGAPHTEWVLTGEAHYVLDGDAADVLLVAAVTPDGVGLFEVDPRQRGVTRSALTTMDASRRLAIVALEGVSGLCICNGAALARARDLACIALSAEQVGAAQRALELTVAYTKVRVQFGRPIGGFQALQHRMADLHVLVESARSLSYAAAAAASGGAQDLGLRAAAAKAYCSEALLTVAGQMIQLHGAIGITWEHQAHRYLKRAHGAAQLFGQPAEHIARIAAALVDGR